MMNRKVCLANSVSYPEKLFKELINWDVAVTRND
jgi:hypothetical protein